MKTKKGVQLIKGNLAWSYDTICPKCDSICWIKYGKVEKAICVQCHHTRKAKGPFMCVSLERGLKQAKAGQLKKGPKI